MNKLLLLLILPFTLGLTKCHISEQEIKELEKKCTKSTSIYVTNGKGDIVHYECE
jgi:hypothetical protein